MRVAAMIVGVVSLMVALAPRGLARADVEWSPVTGEFTARYMGYDEESPREDRKLFGEGELLASRSPEKLTEDLQLVAIPLLQYDTGGQDRRRVPSSTRRTSSGRSGTFEELHLTYYGEEVRARRREADPLVGALAAP